MNNSSHERRAFAVRVCLFLAWCFTASVAMQAAEHTFRVMSYNIHHGEGIDGKLDIERIAALIKAEKADIVALQEVDKGTERTQRRNLAAELAQLTGMSFVFSNNYSFQGGEYGNAVLSKFEVTRTTNHWYRMLAAGEQRGLLLVQMLVHGQPLALLNTHLDHRSADPERLLSVEHIRGVVRALPDMPILICGDFNDVPGSRTYMAMHEFMLDAWELAGAGKGFTIPVRNPNRRIDYVWISKGAPFRPTKAWVPSSEASDHLPLVVEFTFVSEKR